MSNCTPQTASSDIDWGRFDNDTDAQSSSAAGRTDQSAAVATNEVAPRNFAAAAAVPVNLPPFPDRVSYLLGRLPIKFDTAEAIIQLPEPIKGFSCAVVVVNSGILSDCYRDNSKACGVPVALRGQPINDREIKVWLDAKGGDGKVRGLGWVAGDYQGSAPKTRSIEIGVPYVEVVVYVGVDCGCASDKWAPETPQWG